MGTRRVFVSLAVLAVSVALLPALSPFRPAGPRKRTAEVGGYRDDVGSRRLFRVGAGPEAYDLAYGFIDHEGESHDVTCRVLRRDHERAVARFGYTGREMDASTTSRQQAWADEELRRRGLAPYYRIEVDTKSVGFRSIATPGQLEVLGAARIAEHRAAVRSLQDEVIAKTREFESDFLRERGFVLEGQEIAIDYPRLVGWFSPGVLECAKALRWAGAGYDGRQYLGMFTAFLQEIPYQIPPDVQGGKETQGFWVPTEVLVNDHGDCDSKAVVFCALWRGFGSPMIFVVLPRHVLVGVATTPGPGQHFVRIGNRYFVLCEVAGPGKFAPGEVNVEGSYRYRMVEGSRP